MKIIEDTTLVSYLLSCTNMWLYGYFWIGYDSFKTDSHWNGFVSSHSQIADHLISHVIDVFVDCHSTKSHD
jgi:hypothetical protein